jgi:hypothetical protein
MNHEEKKNVYAALAAPFPETAIERTDGAVTGRGYSTTGIKYQHIVNRLNEVLGVGGYRTQQEVRVQGATTQRGRPVYEATCELTLQLGEWVNGEFVMFAEAFGIGGHTAVNEADARKGAYTNGLKKAAAMLGCGRQAYEGTLDDDNAPSASVQETRPPVNRHERNRLTSKQLGALWTLARKLDIDGGAFRNRVQERFGCTVEFLGRQDASFLIGELSARIKDRELDRDQEVRNAV